MALTGRPATPLEATNEIRPQILMVDDNPNKLFSLESVLSELPVELVTASSAREALKQLLRRDDFAVILLDVSMPDMNGFELASMIRQRPRFEFTPIIFITSISTSEAEMARGYGMGAVDYLFMPVVSEVLKAKVSALADLYRKGKQIERQASELASLNRQLEGQLRHIETLNRQLALSNRELESFTYSVSHDLRTPLGSVSNYCSLLSSEFGDELGAKGRKYVELMESGLVRAEGLIQGFLDLTRVSQAPLLAREVDLVDLARTLLPTLADHQRVDWILPERLPAWGDPSLLAVALENLLGNAIKFSSRSERPRIELGVMAGDGNEASEVFFLKDNGAGFPAEYAERLFTPFQRQQSELGGSGIGLTIVQRVISRHGGTIWAEGDSGQGAVFYFRLGRTAAGGPA